MFRTLTTAAALAALTALSLSSAHAATGDAAAPKASAKKAAKRVEAEPVSAPNDNLNPGQLAAAERVLTGVAECEFKEKVDLQKIDGHPGNFKLTYQHKAYVMVPEETTTGAVRLMDTTGAVVWVQIPRKSMLMNQREHHRMVDDCVQNEQRVALQSAR